MEIVLIVLEILISVAVISYLARGIIATKTFTVFDLISSIVFGFQCIGGIILLLVGLINTAFMLAYLICVLVLNIAEIMIILLDYDWNNKILKQF